MQISEVVSELGQVDTYCCESDLSLLDAAKILNKNKIGALPVVDDDYGLVGVISERDIVRCIAERADEFFGSSVEMAMSSKVITCTPDDQVEDVYKRLIANRIRHIPVVEDGELSVMLSIRDFDRRVA